MFPEFLSDAVRWLYVQDQIDAVQSLIIGGLAVVLFLSTVFSSED